ncbi:hypothetical protein Cfor_01948 [Coptotermes formosanus]|uniref:Uncharacterized protein n=1 Tax=Coptotermes formosanus TaxID=36987 RepID=A0A6L2PC72_COPFO|nr:hypothetical protein Cfor_01948 [Coptotermes formosanus]
MLRANRKYLFLPVVKVGSNVSGSSSMKVENIFTMRKMDYVPDLVVARVTRNMNEPKANKVNADHLNRSCDNILTKSLTSCNSKNSVQRGCTGNSSSEIVRIVSSEFKIELRTHRFTGAKRSKNLLLDVWIPGDDGFCGRFLKSAVLFPDKTKDVKGKS